MAFFYRGFDSRVDTFGIKGFFNNADAPTFEVSFQTLGVVRNIHLNAGGIPYIISSNGLKQ